MLTNESNDDFDNCVLKYTGFSVSKGLDDIDHVMKTKIGTPRYMAPVIQIELFLKYFTFQYIFLTKELFNNNKPNFNYKIDIW